MKATFSRSTLLLTLILTIASLIASCGSSSNNSNNPPTSNTGGNNNNSDPGIGDTNFATQNDLAACNPNNTSYVASFPGAEGFGSCATGGRGGRVIHVTNLNSSGEGSLQAALNINETRTIVFDVSGVIRAPVHIKYGNVTIAGQSSPGGITVLGLLCDNTFGNGDNCYNVIVRNIRSRPANVEGANDDALRLDGVQNVIIDHCSFGNASDEEVQISQSANLSFQNSILAETLGAHVQYGGMLLNYSTVRRPQDYISIHHNHWNRLEGRMPEISCEDNTYESGNSSNCGNHTLHLEVSNNLLWDAGIYVSMASTSNNSDPDLGSALNHQLNFVGNFAQVRSNYPYALIDLPTPRSNGQISTYFQDNQLSLYPGRSDYQLNYCCNDYSSLDSSHLPTPPAFARSSRHDFASITYTASNQLRTYILENTGAFPRDAMDQRLMSSVSSNSISLSPSARNINPAADALNNCTNASSEGNTIPSDSDQDGIPDSWESAHGLNPNLQDHNGYNLNSHYTNLEIYLNELMSRRLTEHCL